MSKSPKTAPTPSWRTLMRRAKTAPRAEAKVLREQASSLRRAERKAAKKPVKTSYVQTATVRPVENKLRKAFEATMTAGVGHAAEATGANPDHHLRVKARAILVAARKKGGGAEQQVVDALERLIGEATYEGKAAAEHLHLDNVKQMSEAQRINVVASFMAQTEAMAKANGGPLPAVVPVSGFVLARVMDTLTKAGYSSEGYNFGKALGMR
jgi:hypothetical protein